MAVTTFDRLGRTPLSRTALLLSLFSLLARTSSATCYTPGGDTATDIPCTSANSDQHLNTENESFGLSTCCPIGFKCLPNGLCQNPSTDQPAQPDHIGTGLYGRYSCTNKSFNGCLDVCTTFSQGGDEALLECSSNLWCCDRNRESGDCCEHQIPGSPFFHLQGTGTQVFLAGSSGGGGSGAPSATSHSSAPPPASNPPTSTPPSSTPPTSSPATTSRHHAAAAGHHAQVKTTESTNSVGSVKTIMVTIQPSGSAAASSSSSTSSSSSSNLGLIVGCAVGIPLGVILIAAIAFFLWRRNRKSKPRKVSSSYQDNGMGDDDHSENMQFAAPWMKKTGTEWNPSEADGLPIANVNRVGSTDKKEKAELQGDIPDESKTSPRTGTDVSPPTATTTTMQGSPSVPPLQHAEGGIWGKSPEGPIHEMPAEKYDE